MVDQVRCTFAPPQPPFSPPGLLTQGKTYEALEWGNNINENNPTPTWIEIVDDRGTTRRFNAEWFEFLGPLAHIKTMVENNNEQRA